MSIAQPLRVAGLATGLALAATPALQAALKPGFEALPAETVGALRYDLREEMLAPYREQTLLGELFLSPERGEAFRAMVKEMIAALPDDTGEKVHESLANFGLEVDDVLDLLNSQFGAAVIDLPVPEHASMHTALFWLEGDPETVDKIHATLFRAVDESDAVERVDEAVLGTKISRLIQTESGDSIILARLENRIAAAIGFPAAGSIQSEADGEAYEAAEFNMLGTFLQASKSGIGGFLEKVYADPVIARNAPSYSKQFELLVDLNALLPLIPAESQAMIPALGLDGFTHLGLWTGLDGTRAATELVLGMPAPRTGIPALFEMEAQPFAPPAWTPAQITSYTEFSFDFPHVYEVALGIARQMVGPAMVDMQIEQANAQAQGILGVTIDQFVAAFGKRVQAIQYPMQFIDMEVADGESVTLPTASQALVIDFNKPEVIAAALAMSGAFTSNPNSPVQPLEDEMGFSGIRMDAEGLSQVWAYGLGKIVFAQGPDASSRLFATLNTPPEGEDALVNDPRFRSAMRAEKPEPGIFHQYQDGPRAMENFLAMLNQSEGTASTLETATELPLQAWLKAFKDYLPEEELIQGLFEYAYTFGELTDDGIVIESVTQLK